MVSGIALSLFSFQEKAVLKLMDMTTDSREKQTIIMKAPTGAGKTIILIDFVDEYLSKVNRQTAFIWLCPGKGDLEEQSREKMESSRRAGIRRICLMRCKMVLCRKVLPSSTGSWSRKRGTQPFGMGNGRICLTG